eukprot:TRINITY_DN46_c0_g1_i6.p1 TRINITY_DN46_c0_g1~~TRINITY_DN46_c0_g1_i6.p1  ORF type:complete len:494 (-),score=111.77 TRINITY_DN46_c0_g1_i6:46-1344(-)
METNLTEIGIVMNDLSLAAKNLRDWMKPEKPSVPLINMLDKCQVIPEPKGVCLIIGAWNYPIQLTLLPLVGAIAAGNCAVLKPSEIAANTAKVIESLMDYLDPKCFAVVNGGIPETQELLRQRWDHIFYTGAGPVGKIVMKAAAEHLASVTLELGGKSPVFVDSDVDIKNVGRRLAWGRFMNCGQTCIAPDYVLCPSKLIPPLVENMRAALIEFYGADPQKSADYGRIINGNHFRRLSALLTSGTVAIGGQTDAADNYIAPTVLTDVDVSSPVMQDEIFGPILPIVPMESITDAIKFVQQRPKPLALYVFTNNSAVADRVIKHTSSGSVVVNDVLMQAAVHTLPFGGTGPSGLGAYHGRESFVCFSHRRAVMKKPMGLEAVNDIRYPPYTEKKFQTLKWLLFPAPLNGGSGFSKPRMIVLAAVLAFLFYRFR